MFKQVAIGLLMLCPPCLAGHAATGARVDVPIGQMVLPNGDIRYFVPVAIGGAKPVDALLDTGSTGLRVLRSAVSSSGVKASDLRMRHTFASGGLFEGVRAEAALSVGAAATPRPVAIEVVESVVCVERRPNCAAAKMDQKHFLMASGGFAGHGFPAILGISMRRKPPHDSGENPLTTMGDASWIVELPAQGATAPGHLIINPTPEDRAGSILVKLQPQPNAARGAGDEDPAAHGGVPGWMDGALAGCLVDKSTERRYCGRTLLDTGAPGFTVDAPQAGQRDRWPDGTSASLAFDGGDRPIGLEFTTGPAWPSKVTLRPPRNPDVLRISAGTLPYFSYAILYDAKAGTIGFKPRERS